MRNNLLNYLGSVIACFFSTYSKIYESLATCLCYKFFSSTSFLLVSLKSYPALENKKGAEINIIPQTGALNIIKTKISNIIKVTSLPPSSSSSLSSFHYVFSPSISFISFFKITLLTGSKITIKKVNIRLSFITINLNYNYLSNYFRN